MILPERALYFAPDGSPTGPIARSSEDITNSEVSREGDFAEVLGDFLGGYFSDQVEQHPHYIKIPQIASELLVPLLEYRKKDTLVIRGSLAKCIAAGIPANFWEYRKYFREKATSLSALNNQTVIEILDGFTIDPDVDLKIRLQNDSTIMSLFGWYVYALKHTYELFAADSHTIAGDDEGPYFRNERRFHLDNNFDITVEAGPNPANLKRQLMIISIIDVRSQRSVFHVDIGDFPKTSFDQEAERRLGKTSLKQDECLIPLFLHDQKPRYQLSRSVEKLMQRQDELTTEKESADDVIDLFLRALRINLLHEIKSIQMANGEYLHLPKLDMLLPQFKSDSLLALYDRMIEFSRRDEPVGDRIRLWMMRELALCLTIDPYVTIQALRDSGISLLIPGLQYIRKEQWDKILQSRWFVVAPRVTNPKNRTFDYMESERDHYMEGDQAIHLDKPFDGLKRFILALRDLQLVSKTGNEWLQYVKLWDTRRDVVIPLTSVSESVPDKSEEPVGPLGVRLDDKEFILVPLEDGPPTPERVEELLQLFREQDSGRGKGRKIDTTIHNIGQYMPGTNIGEAVRRARELGDLHKIRHIELDETERAEVVSTWNRTLGVSALYTILEEFPSGLTPRQLMRLFVEKLETAGYRHQEFQEALFDLKSLSFVERYRQERVHRRGHIEHIDFYSLRKSRLIRKLSSLAMNGDFLDFLKRQAATQVPVGKSEYPITLEDIINIGLVSLPMAGIQTIEALEVINGKDLEVVISWLKKDGIESINMDLLSRLVTTILNVYQEYTEERSV